MKKMSKVALGILAVTMATGMAAAAFADDQSPREREWDRAFAAKPYAAVAYTPEDYQVKRGDMDERWTAELLAKPYAAIAYAAEDYQIERGNMDERWAAELLAKPYVAVTYAPEDYNLAR